MSATKTTVNDITEALRFVASEMDSTKDNATVLKASKEAKLKELQNMIMHHANDIKALATELESLI